MKIENGTGCRLYTFNEYELNQHDAKIRKQAYAEGYQQGKFDTLADLEADEHYVKKLEKELAELKENAIVPKFKDKEWVYTIQDGKIYNVCVERDVFIEYSFVYNCKPHIDEDGFEDIDCDFAIENEKNLFKTKEEAEKALKGEANAKN